MLKSTPGIPDYTQGTCQHSWDLTAQTLLHGPSLSNFFIWWEVTNTLRENCKHISLLTQWFVHTLRKGVVEEKHMISVRLFSELQRKSAFKRKKNKVQNKHDCQFAKMSFNSQPFLRSSQKSVSQPQVPKHKRIWYDSAHKPRDATSCPCFTFYHSQIPLSTGKEKKTGLTKTQYTTHPIWILTPIIDHCISHNLCYFICILCRLTDLPLIQATTAFPVNKSKPMREHYNLCEKQISKEAGRPQL